MDVSVVVPYRPDPRSKGVCRLIDGAPREHIWEWLEKRWVALHPHFELVVAEPATEVMNRAEARNIGAAKADGEVLIFADADVVAHRRQIEAALAQIEFGADWVIAYREYIQMDGPDTRAVLEREPTAPVPRPRVARWATHDGNAGMLVMTRNAFNTVAGYDDRFVKWGWEDWAIANALTVLCHPEVRVDGYVVHLHHPRDRDRSKRQGEQLFNRYHRALGDPEAMSALCEEHR